MSLRAKLYSLWMKKRPKSVRNVVFRKMAELSAGEGNAMSLRAKLYSLWMKKRPKSVSAAKVVVVGFALVILLGACLLNLPLASRSGVSCGFRPALFTATSATCVTGLVLYDTWTQWSAFGQVVILCLIQTGGLGFMSVATLLIFFLRKRIGLKQRLVMAQALSLNDIDGVVRLQRTVLMGSFASVATLLIFFLRKRIGLKQRLVMAQALSLNDIDGVVRLQRTVLMGSFAVEGIGALILMLGHAADFLPAQAHWLEAAAGDGPGIELERHRWRGAASADGADGKLCCGGHWCFDFDAAVLAGIRFLAGAAVGRVSFGVGIL